MAHRKEESQAPEGSSDESQEGPYPIGYGCPPNETRFKPGKSGNPNGRPKRPPTLKSTIAKILKERVLVREGERVQKVSKLDAFVRITMNQALKGDSKSIRTILEIMKTTSGPEEDVLEPAEVVGEDDEAILADYLARRGAGISPSEGESSQKAKEPPKQANASKSVRGKK